MRDLFILSDGSLCLSSLALKPSVGVAVSGPDDRGVLYIWEKEGDARIRVTKDNSILSYYEDPLEIDVIRAFARDPDIFVVEFNRVSFLRELLFPLESLRLLVDNEFGLIEPISVFVERMRAAPGWDWIADDLAQRQLPEAGGPREL